MGLGAGLSAWHLCVMGVADGFSEPRVQFFAIQDDLVGVHGLDCIERHDKIT